MWMRNWCFGMPINRFETELNREWILFSAERMTATCVLTPLADSTVHPPSSHDRIYFISLARQSEENGNEMLCCLTFVYLLGSWIITFNYKVWWVSVKSLVFPQRPFRTCHVGPIWTELQYELNSTWNKTWAYLKNKLHFIVSSSHEIHPRHIICSEVKSYLKTKKCI